MVRMEVKAKPQYTEQERGMRIQRIQSPLRKGGEIKHHKIECAINMT